MNNKVFIVLSLIFSVRLLSSCCPGDCVNRAYEINYGSVSTTLYNTAGFTETIVEDSVFSRTFGISVSVNFELNQVALSNSVESNFGFNQAMACSCIGDNYVYNDSINFVNLFVKDVEKNETKMVNDIFDISPFDDNMWIYNAWSYDDDTQSQRDGFEFELFQYDSIPDSAIFIVEVNLASGLILTDTTESIKFYD